MLALSLSLRLKAPTLNSKLILFGEEGVQG